MKTLVSFDAPRSCTEKDKEQFRNVTSDFTVICSLLLPSSFQGWESCSIYRLLVEKPLIYTWNQGWHLHCAFAISTKSFLVAWFMAGGSRGLTTSTYSSKFPSPAPLSTPCFTTGTTLAAPQPPAALLNWKGRSQSTHVPTLPLLTSSFTPQPLPAVSPLTFLLSLPDPLVNWRCSWNSRKIFSYFCKEESSDVLVNKSAKRWGPKSARACTR